MAWPLLLCPGVHCLHVVSIAARASFSFASVFLSVQVTCGVASAVMTEVLEVVEGNLAVKGVKANVITSGHGQWR